MRLRERDAWTWILLAIAGGLAARLVALAGDGPALEMVASLLLLAGWSGAALFLLADPRRRRFWTIWLLAAHLALLLFGPRDAGRYIALALAAVFLLLRRQRAWQALTRPQRARGFYLGLLTLAALVPGFESEPVGAWLPGTIRSLGLLSLHALRIFWLLALATLLLGMRLHFLRLKPKLAVSALFTALVPLLLVVTLVLLGAYGILGASCAGRGIGVLQHWAELAGAGGDVSPIFGEPLRLDPDTAAPPSAPWAGALLRHLGAGAGGREANAGAEEEEDEPPWTAVDTSAYFRIGEEVWLVRARGVPARPSVEAYRLEAGALGRLSRILGAEAGVLGSDNVMLGGRDDGPGDAPAPEEPDLLERQLGYGASMLPVIRLTPSGMRRDQVFFHLQVRLGELGREHLAGADDVGRALLLVLGIVAAVLLLMIVVAVFLGVRITGGILGAVAALRAGTQRLAAGDLETRIEVPNQDELGDLAVSFNEMAAAVRRGREEAIARERLEREMDTARAIQQRLLPDSAPALAGWQITGVSLPSRQVGGDYYDFLPLPDGRLGLAIGDVSGKGIPAALLMANLQAALRGQILHEEPVAVTVARINTLLARATEPHLFATFFYGVLDPASGELVCCNAGHWAPLLIRAGGEVVRLEQGGLLLGMLPERPYEEQRIVIGPGDVLVMFTDGITEAAPGEEAGEGEAEMFGEDRLLALLRQARGQSAGQIRESVLAAVRAYAGEADDDLTLVVARREGRG